MIAVHAAPLARHQLSAPAVMADVELGQPLPVAASLKPGDAASIRMLVRLHGHPIGIIDLAATALADIDLRTLVWARCSGDIKGHLARYHAASAQAIPERGFPDEDPSLCSWRAVLDGQRPAATLVINTCAPSEALALAVTSALQQDYPRSRLIVVDNRPATSGLGEWLGKRFGDGLTYVAAQKPGLGRARNAGLAAATTDIVAFTDDDVVLDPSWLGWMVAGFAAAEGVACVTGLIVPLELETQAQVLMEEFSGFGKGFEQRIWDRDEHRPAHPLYPYTVGLFGSGASAAFRKDVLASLGGFDPHLGIGTPAIGGEDIDIYTRLVLGGHRIVYQPASLLRHRHRREMSAANRQIQGYGAGLTAMLTKHVLTDAATRNAILRRIPAGLRYAISPGSPKNARRPPEFTMRQSLLEWAGMAYGPIGYVRSRLAG